MKSIISLLFLLLSLNGLSQSTDLKGNIIKRLPNIELGNLRIFLKAGDTIKYSTNTDSQGYFNFNNVDYGIYQLVIQQIGYRDDIIDNFTISNFIKNQIDIEYPGPCKFNYVKGRKPTCIAGHTDKIIPIVYGLPSKETMKKEGKGLIRLGGCMVSDCDPLYYCIIHKREL